MTGRVDRSVTVMRYAWQVQIRARRFFLQRKKSNLALFTLQKRYLYNAYGTITSTLGLR